MRTLNLDTLTLDRGDHESIDYGACLLEAVSYVAGEAWSDRPLCVSPVLGAFGRALNDVLSDDRRQMLKPLIPQMVGTWGDGVDQARGLMAADWLVRVYTPTWLRLAGLDGEAVALEGLGRLATWDDVVAAGPVVADAKEKARAAWVARDAAGAALDAAEAALDAARAAWDAADAARVARVAAEAAWDAGAAWDAAGAALDAAEAAWDAAGVALVTGAALQPTVDRLQDSAIALYTAMITPEPTT